MSQHDMVPVGEAYGQTYFQFRLRRGRGRWVQVKATDLYAALEQVRKLRKWRDVDGVLGDVLVYSPKYAESTQWAPAADYF